jgi:hypothetical protein
MITADAIFMNLRLNVVNLDTNPNTRISMRTNRGGYALLLMLLIVVVIGCIVSFSMNGGALFHRKAQKDSSGQLLPWSEENRLVGNQGQIKMPSPSQPAITNVLGYKSYPKENSQERGELILFIAPDGRVKGSWSGDFREGSGVSLSVLAADFKGNIDSSKVYTDKAGQDTSKLYFIARGGFILLEENKKHPESSQRRGYIYVTGWIDPDYKSSGRITLTSDKNDYRIFTWADARCQKDLPFMF